MLVSTSTGMEYGVFCVWPSDQTWGKLTCQMSSTTLKRGTYMLRFQSVMVSPDNADKDDANVTLRTCLSADCAANTIIDDYKYVNAEIDYAKLSFTGTKDPKITV